MNELTKTLKRYNKVCERLEQLNEEAFELEQHILHLEAETDD